MESQVDQIKSRLDVVDVISEYVQLKQSGQNWKGVCPFHSEKTPSFMVHREKQIWHCFGCNKGGDIFEFVKEIENLEFPEALEILARKANVELKHIDKKESGKKSKALELVQEADNYFYDQLLKSPRAAVARDYLKNRGIDIELAKTFHLGYAPDSWDSLSKYLLAKGYAAGDLVGVGLAVQHSRGSVYDKFRDRIMFPILDIHGRAIGFGGRLLKDKNEEPKYMNSPQSLVYNKSLVLYNLNQAKNAIKEKGYAVLVEGYMDVIGCYQAGITNVVSTSGTALTSEQIKILKRYVKEFRLAFDADLAGQSAVERGIDLVLQAEVEVKIITMPDGEDPDSWARKNPEEFLKSIDHALPIGDYTLEHLIKKIDTTSREGKKQASELMLKAIVKLPNPIDRDYYLKKTSKDLGVDETSLRERLATVERTKNTFRVPAPSTQEVPAKKDRESLLMQKLVSVLLYFPEEASNIFASLEPKMIIHGEAQELYNRALVFYTERQQLNVEELKKELVAEEHLSKLLDTLYLQAERDFNDLELTDKKEEVGILIHALKSIYFTRERKFVNDQIKIAEQSNNQTELIPLLEHFNDLNRQLSQLEKNYGENQED